jgi:hypothetical protein
VFFAVDLFELELFGAFRVEDLLAEDFLAGLFFADAFLAEDFLAGLFFADAFLAEDFLAGLFFADAFLAEDFLALAEDFFAAAFLGAVFFFAFDFRSLARAVPPIAAPTTAAPAAASSGFSLTAVATFFAPDPTADAASSALSVTVSIADWFSVRVMPLLLFALRPVRSALPMSR